MATRTPASALRPGDRHHAAAAALREGRVKDGVRLLDELLAENPDDVIALLMVGSQLSKAEEAALADERLGRAMQLAPDDPAVRMAWAEHLQRFKRSAAALAALDGLPPLLAEKERALSLRAEALSTLGRSEEELALLRVLAARARQPLDYAIRIGNVLRSLGREDEAAQSYRSILARAPSDGLAWWSLANLKAVKFSLLDVRALEQAVAVGSMPVDNRIRLLFALGKAHEDGGDIEKAFKRFDEANRLHRQRNPYKIAPVLSWVEECERDLTPALFSAAAGEPSDAPIFIVGMQRSGSTLVEQILASHPGIEGTAELPLIPDLVYRLGEEAHRAGVPFFAHLAGKSGDERRALGQAYLRDAAAFRATDRPRFTDKMPNNWMHVGLIRAILPNARIVDVRRDPLACGLSNWKHLYAKGLEHSSSLDTMGQYYAAYVRLMRHFDRVLPGAVHRVIYEDLVDDLEATSRSLTDFLGLPFDAAMLDFHRTERSVRTISASQVRRPLNRQGIESWRPYDRFLGPLRKGLGGALESWRT